MPSSKNVRFLARGPSGPFFLIILKILFLVAAIQLLASSWILVPEWISHAASYLARRDTLQEAVQQALNTDRSAKIITEKNREEISLNPTSYKKTQKLQPADVSQEVLKENETSSKTVSSNLESGFQSGNYLTIISIQHTPGVDGEQILKIAIKAQEHEVISVSEVKVQVYFYDQSGGAIVASKSPVTSRWLNAAVDWKNGDPQLLEVTYQPSNNNPDAHYLGYVVAIYYQGELQSYRADPPMITNQFPIKVYIGKDEF
jgi:hypothetical protein